MHTHKIHHTDKNTYACAYVYISSSIYIPTQGTLTEGEGSLWSTSSITYFVTKRSIYSVLEAANLL